MCTEDGTPLELHEGKRTLKGEVTFNGLAPVHEDADTGLVGHVLWGKMIHGVYKLPNGFHGKKPADRTSGKKSRLILEIVCAGYKSSEIGRSGKSWLPLG